MDSDKTTVTFPSVSDTNNFLLIHIRLDAASEHQHSAGLRQREGRRAELHPKPQSVPLHFPERARAAH